MQKLIESRVFPFCDNADPGTSDGIISYRVQIQIQAVSSDVNESPNFHGFDGTIYDFDFSVDQTRFSHSPALFHAKSKANGATI